MAMLPKAKQIQTVKLVLIQRRTLKEQDRPGNELKCPWATNQMLMVDLLGLFGPILSQ